MFNKTFQRSAFCFAGYRYENNRKPAFKSCGYWVQGLKNLKLLVVG